MISVIMPAYLAPYQGAATNRDEKFIRAVDSFLSQTYQDKELIIISDGCINTAYYFLKKYRREKNIIFIHIPKQVMFSGTTRNIGLKVASGETICYLDTDDYLGKNHLQLISEQIGDSDWIYWDDYLAGRKRHTELAHTLIGTSCWAHKKTLPVEWKDGYGHDWATIYEVCNPKYKYNKVKEAEYFVCHQEFSKIDV